MTSDDLIRKINIILKNTWTTQDCIRGKKINVEWSWAKSINVIVKKYAAKGWTVTKHVEIDGEKRFLFLTFKNMKWAKNPARIKKS